MYKWFLTAAAVCLLGVSAVAVAEDSYYLELPTKGVTSSRKITVDVPGENPVEDGVNPLTGESWYGNYYPILVNIDAHPEALPHWGVASADVSYEMPVQADSSTRSAMLFMGTIPAYAGPVRSGRVPMGSLREIWAAHGCSTAGRTGPTATTPSSMWMTGRCPSIRMRAKRAAGCSRSSRAPSATMPICSIARTMASMSRRTTFRSI
ncbi:MAG: DUF3048 domain-containing protein [Christensenellales bacterium]